MTQILEEPSKRITPIDVISKVSLLKDINAGLKLTDDSYISRKHPLVISFINAHAFNYCCEHEEFCNAMLASDIIFRDGTGMKMLYDSLDIDPGINFCGTDFIPQILNQYSNKTIALLGTNEPYLQRAKCILNNQGKHVVVTDHGFHKAEYYVSLIQKAKPEIIVLAMGMPKQELISQVLKNSLNYPCIIINGGAVVDIIAGKVSRAPKWIRKAGMEWVYRLLMEPKRLFKRYIFGNFVFLKRVRQLKKQLVLIENKI